MKFQSDEDRILGDIAVARLKEDGRRVSFKQAKKILYQTHTIVGEW